MKRLLLTMFTLVTVLPISLFVGVQSIAVRAAGCSSVSAIADNHGVFVTPSLAVVAGETLTLSPGLSQSRWIFLKDTTGKTYATVYANTTTATKPGFAYAQSGGAATQNHTYSLIGCPPGASAGILLRFNDGRCNQAPDAPVVVYPDGNGGYYVYTVDKGIGYFALYLTKAQLDANPARPDNFMIADNLGARLYRLAGGQLQVDRYKPDGKDYAFIFPPCDI